ncbi:murein L,D-transpeptidase catalytic domain family protein [Pedobacter alpinus]|uniref:Murein L,D-transpeptidase catalytic domain family protein n=1 Tax=Pedobacter alpinus TaxID=1590643 RepID=A0ABW5TP03_9SPHI
MKFIRNKRFKTYSVKGLIVCTFVLTFLSLSWKTSKDKPTISATNSVHDSISNIVNNEISFTNLVNDLYKDADLKKANLALPVFEKALIGFVNLKSKNALNENKDILTIVDFTKPSTEKRMWIVDLKNKTLLLNTHVAHGQGSGADMATNFSNIAESHQSSLGFYIASETYFGKHGLSLKLDGQDKGINDLARERAIVVHGAKYVSENFIKSTGRLGRSYGCPAVSEELNAKVIELIKGKTCFFINGNSKNYQSALLDNTNMSDIVSI